MFVSRAQSLRDSLVDMQIGSRKVVLKRFSVGKATPQLLSARTYDIGPDALGFDFDTSWESELVAQLEAVPIDEEDDEPYGDTVDTLRAAVRGARVPVTVRNLRFSGPVRVIVTHLTADDPGFGSILLSLPAPPEIGLDVRVAGGEVTRVPFFRDELERVLKRSLVDEYLWPRRMILPADNPGMVGVPVLSPEQLEELTYDDPLLRAERALAEQPAVGELEKDRRALDTQADANLTINLGVLPDFSEIASMDLSKILTNWTGELGELTEYITDFRSFGNFSESQKELGGRFAEAISLAEALSKLDFGDQKELIEGVASLTNQTELVERLANLTELVDLAELGEQQKQGLVFFAELGQQLRETGRRFERAELGANGSSPWWRFGFGAEHEADRAAIAVNGSTIWWRRIPFIGGDQEDEDRMLAFSDSNSTTSGSWWRFGGSTSREKVEQSATGSPARNQSVLVSEESRGPNKNATSTRTWSWRFVSEPPDISNSTLSTQGEHADEGDGGKETITVEGDQARVAARAEKRRLATWVDALLSAEV